MEALRQPVAGGWLDVPRERSFSRALITIQSSSPRTSRASSVCRRAEIGGSASRDSLRRVLGLGGSSSRIIRRTSE
jgi:hypothetical protein